MENTDESGSAGQGVAVAAPEAPVQAPAPQKSTRERLAGLARKWEAEKSESGTATVETPKQQVDVNVAANEVAQAIGNPEKMDAEAVKSAMTATGAPEPRPSENSGNS